MCGLAGWLGAAGVEEHQDEILAALHHRGPDGTGVETWPGAGLLHTRLKIIDLSRTGAQPMTNENSSVFVVFNGEIYNHHELRRDLEARGHVFRGRSDTEVLPHLYEEYGRDMFSRLRGMFTVAIYDLRRRSLLLARDRFGIKPLFYAQKPNLVAFASELNALRLVPGLDLTPDRQAIADYAALFYVPAPHTFFRGIRVLEPGTFLEAQHDRAGNVEARTTVYHRWALGDSLDLSLDDAVETADALVEEAVARQLESDVPLGALLSGGIDSSLVSAAASRRNGAVLHTFNVRFPDADYDETDAARAVASHIRSTHETLDMSEDGGSWDQITSLLRQAGQPFADTSLFGVDTVSRAMRQRVTVALSGDGGDEVFGGYDFYRRLPAIDVVRSLPAPVGWGMAQVAGLAARASLARPALARRIREVNGADDTAIVEGIFSWIEPHDHVRLVVDGDRLEPPRRLFEQQWQGASTRRYDRLLARTVEANIRLVLPNDFLFKVDTASMRHSLEVRVPMLDEDLVTFGLRLPNALRANRKNGKVVLRAVAERRLPREIARRPKRGFAVPVDRWVDATFRENLRSALLSRESRLPEYLNPAVYGPWVAAFESNQPTDGVTRDGLYQRVVMLLSLDLALRSSPS